MFGGDVARLAFDVGPEAGDGVAQRLRRASRRIERSGRRGDDMKTLAGKGRIARLRRLVGRIGQRGHARWRKPYPAPFDDRTGVSERRRVRHGRARGDHPGIVAGHVGDGEGDERCRTAGLGQPAALDLRQVLSHAVDLADAGAAAQQRPRHRLLVGEADALRRQQPVGRAAAGDQRQDEIVRPGASREFDDTGGGFEAAAVGQRVTGLDHLDRRRIERVAVAGDRKPGQAFGRDAGGAIMVDGGSRHRCGGLACGEDDDPALRRLGQMRCKDCRRMGGGDGGSKDRRQIAAQRGVTPFVGQAVGAARIVHVRLPLAGRHRSRPKDRATVLRQRYSKAHALVQHRAAFDASCGPANDRFF